MNNRFNKVFSAFNLFNLEFSPGSRIIDNFSSHFSFHSFSKCSNNNLISHAHILNNLAIIFSENPFCVLIITNTNIKNNVAMSIAHIHICNKAIVKTLHHVANVTSTEAKLSTIRCGINQAINIQGISKIVVITDLIHTTWRIFNSSHHPFQIHTASILKELRSFFTCNQDNSIEFWECPSQCNWSLHKVVDNETKLYELSPLYLYKSSWDFSKKSKCDNILASWKMMFQASDLKGH